MLWLLLVLPGPNYIFAVWKANDDATELRQSDATVWDKDAKDNFAFTLYV